jgi:putative phosphoesterase
MRIAVISDTHNRASESLFSMLGEADEIWHLGDVCDRSVLDRFLTIGPPLKVVRGNCDSCLDWPLSLDCELQGLKISLAHIPPRRAPAGVDLLLHGHTHVPRNETICGCTFLNPGCITRPNRGAPASFAWLEISGPRKYSWDLRQLKA